MDVEGSDEEFSLHQAGDGARKEGHGRPREEDQAALRAALHFHVGEICSGETTGKPMTGASVATLTEMVFKYTEALALDLRVFAKHGKRACVGVDDVKCVARKDPKMVEKLAEFEAANLNTGKKKASRTKKKQQHQEASTAQAPSSKDVGAATDSTSNNNGDDADEFSLSNEIRNSGHRQRQPPPRGSGDGKSTGGWGDVHAIIDGEDEAMFSETNRIDNGRKRGASENSLGRGRYDDHEDFDELLL